MTTHSSDKNEEESWRSRAFRSYASFLSHRPLVVIGCVVFVWFLCLALSTSKFDMDTEPPRGRAAYALRDSTLTNKLDALAFAQRANFNHTAVQSTRSLASEDSFLSFIYADDTTGNVLTAENLEWIRTFEKRVRDDPIFHEYCFLCPLDNVGPPVPGCEGATSSNPVCRPPASLVNFFFPSAPGKPDGLGTTMEPFASTLAELTTGWRLNPQNPVNTTSFYFSEEVVAGSTSARMIRSQFRLGLPLKGFTSAGIDNFDQVKILDDQTVELFHRTFRKYADSAPGSMNVYVGGGRALMQWEVEKALAHDQVLVVFALLFVTFLMSFHMKSAFLGSVAMMHIMFTFPMSIFVFRVLMGIEYFDLLNFFLVFIIIGVGADDCFIFYDAWIQVGHETDDIHERLYQSLRRAASAMFVTSATTAGAFAATTSSPSMPVIGFGVFATFVVTFNYLHVISIFPAMVVAKTVYVDRYCCTKCCNGKKGSGVEPESPSALDETATEETMAGVSVRGLDRRRPVERFMFRHYVRWLYGDGKQRNIIVLVLSLCMVTAFIYFMTTLEQATEPPQILPSDWNAMQFLDRTSEFRPSSEGNNIRLYVVWGVDKKVDRLGHSIFDFGSDACQGGACGEVRWTSDFSLRDPQSQQLVLDVCSEGVQAPRMVGVIRCFMRDFRDWRVSRNESFPVPAVAFDAAMRNFMISPEGAFFERTKDVYMAENGKLRYASIMLSVDFNRVDFAPKSVNDRMLEWWNDYMYRKNTNAPAGASQGFMTTHTNDAFFVRTEMADAFTTSAVRGVGIAVCVAFVVLTAFTGNYIVSTFAFWWVVCVSCSAIGLVAMMGWTVGPIEAICASLVVGFSVDYVVHLAEHYVIAPYKLREARMTITLLEMGVSVVSGAVTTFGVAVFLVFCKVQLFSTFGQFILYTVLFSVATAFLPFSSTLTAIGPNGDTGSTTLLISRIKACCKREKGKRGGVELQGLRSRHDYASSPGGIGV